MPNIDLSILNQRQTPAFYADVFANRPAAGFVGRIFVSTDTYAFYRDNGTGWDLIGGPGTGTVTGSGAAGQVAFWSGSSLISGENNLWWDSTNNHFGINTNTPGTAADIHHNQSTILQLNQTTATNDTRIAFQNSGTSLWRIGNFYNGGANDLGIFDVVGNIQPVTVKKNTGQVLIGTSTVGAGKLVVASASSDNGIQIVGASAPSLRIDSAESGPTKRAGLGISTATNNFIQGSADRDFCIFNGSTAAASPILFGIYDAGAVNVQEAARISAARNFLIGTTTDAGQKLQVSGTALITGAASFSSTLTTSNAIQTNVAGGLAYRAYYGSGNNLPLDINIDSSNGDASLTFNTTYNAGWKYFLNNFAARISNAGSLKFQVAPVGTAGNAISWVDALTFNNTTGAATFSNSVTASTTINIDTSANPTLNFITNSGATTTMFNIVGAAYVGSAPFNSNILRANNSSHISFETGGSERLRITSGGNVGIGVSSLSAFGSQVTALQMPQGVTLYAWNASAVPQLYLGANNYFDGSNFKYIISGQAASLYYQASGAHIWYNAPSGTAGNNISLSQPMTLAATGNLLIGTTTDAGQKLQVSGTARFDGTSGSPVTLNINSSNSNCDITMQSSNSSSVSRIRNNTNDLQFHTNGTLALTLASNQAATFASSVAIGNTVSAAVAAPSTHKVSILIGGVQYYLLASNV